ncbi:unnamed protein product [Oppiella nova]|uniref:Uncharacterized protein n=1 Tax=Oppiella nova TaxID=334625 RepID=A0A7R9QI05_9ACAR|nr:unnamed protein product [Oppiella nova]CAG2165743.1 unnamed protein product [Oppiella nova]
MSSAMDTDATQVVDNATDSTEDNTTDNTADNGVVNNADIKEESPEDDNIIGDDEVVDEVIDGNNGTDGAADVNDNPDGADGDAVDEEVLLMETDCKDITAQSNDATNGDTIDDTGDGNVDESGGDGDGDGISAQLDDNELRTAGLKTSLMLSEEKIDGLNAKVSELESELKKVYQHLITSMDDKKKLEAKCATLQEQLDRVMSKKAGAAISQLQSPQQQRQHQQQSPPKRPAQSVAQKRAAAAIKQSTRVFNNNNAKTRATDRFAGNARPYEVSAMRYTTFGDPYRTPVAVPVPSISNASRQPYGYSMSGPMMANPKSGPLVSSGHEEIEELSARLQVPPHVADKAHQLYEDFYDSVQAMAIGVYSSAKTCAQNLLFCNTNHGNLTPLIDQYFDNIVGVKEDPKSYETICRRISADPKSVLYITDKASEANCAKTAGLTAVMIKRPNNRPQSAIEGVQTISSFKDIKFN